jgi:hypothetical protein
MAYLLAFIEKSSIFLLTFRYKYGIVSADGGEFLTSPLHIQRTTSVHVI